MATSQKFDALDGLKITGGLDVGGNVAVDTDTLFVNSSTDRVGINRSNPAYALDVTAATSAQSVIRIDDGNTFNGTSSFLSNDRAKFGYTPSGVTITDNGAAKDFIINLGTSGSNVNVMFIDESASTTTFNTDITVATGSGSGVITAGDASSTSGALMLAGNYNGANKVATIGSMASSGGIALGYAVRPRPGVANAFVSTAGNSNFNKQALILDSAGLRYFSGPAVTVAIDSNVTMSQVFDVNTSGDITGRGLDLTSTFNTPSNITVSGSGLITAPNVTATTNVNIGNAIVHIGDTNTYAQFHAADQFRVVTGATERFEVNNNGVNAARITANDCFQEKVVAGGSGTAYTLDVNSGSVHTFTPTSSYSIDFSNYAATAAGGSTTFTLVVNNNGTARSCTWPGSGEADKVFWSDGIEPPPSAGIDIYSFINISGQIYGSLSFRNAGFAQ
jgi:hypothetical protein